MNCAFLPKFLVVGRTVLGNQILCNELTIRLKKLVIKIDYFWFIWQTFSQSVLCSLYSNKIFLPKLYNPRLLCPVLEKTCAVA